MKKILLLGAAFLALQAVPALAQEKEGAKPAHDRGAKMFEKLDTNKDGVIDEAESIAKAKERFAEMDANKDGKVTKEEAVAHHDAMKAKRDAYKKEKGEKPEGAPKE